MNDSNQSSGAEKTKGAHSESATGGLRMTPLTAVEVARIATELQSFVGAQLQDCLQTESDFGLAFYHNSETVWLWFDLRPQRPMVVRWSERFPLKRLKKKKIARPLTLFIRSRFEGRRLSSVRAELSSGRILKFSFHRANDEGDPGAIEIEVRLFPHGQNVIARDGEKSISENKPKDLPTATTVATEDEGRSWEEIEAEWRKVVGLEGESRAAAQAAVPERAKLEREYKRAVEKKEAALIRMREEFASKTSDLPSRAGEWLKANGSLENIPAEFADFIDSEKSLSWNIEHCFTRAKENVRKSQGTLARIEVVERELNDLRRKGLDSFSKDRDRVDKVESANLLSGAGARGRRLKIGDDLEVYIGKSAADNMALLRRAQSFDYWLHLRDQPGSHAILRRTRGRLVTDAEFLEAGRWVVEQSLNKRALDLKGERHDMLIVECRFVRPIKGDKLGRVNYTNDRVMRVGF